MLLGSAFKTVMKITAKIVYNVARLLVAGIKKVASAIKNMVTSHSKGLSGLEGGFSSLLKKALAYGIGIRSLYRLFSVLRNNIKEGFNNLTQFNGGANSTNEAMSRLYSSAMQLRNALGAMVAPLLEVVAPALDFLINKLTQVINVFGMFIAKLTGKSIYMQATKMQLNYAGAVGKTAKAKAKENKESQNQLASYDKLNNVNKKEDEKSGSGGGGGAGGLDPNKMFKEVTIPDNISKWVDKFKKWWEDADFTELGTILGTKLKEALESIPWDEIQETAAKVGKSLATLINGFVEVEDLGHTIGKTIGEAINTAIIGINSFLDNTHWKNVGKFIGDGINGMIETIQWSALGHLFAQKYNALFDVIGGAAETINWEEAGENFATAITTFIDDMKWEENGKHFGELLEGLFTTINVTIENVPWEELGTRVGTAINSIFSSFNPTTIGKTLGDAINLIVITAKGLLDGTQWIEIGNWFGTGLNTSVQTVDWNELGNVLSASINDFLYLCIGLIDSFDWLQFGTSIGNGLSSAVATLDVKAIFQTIGDAIIAIILGLSGIVEGIDWNDFAQTLLQWFIDAFTGINWSKLTYSIFRLLGACIGALVSFAVGLGQKLLEVIKAVFNTAKDWFFDVAFENGQFTIEGLLKGILDALSSIGKWIVDNIFKPFIDGFKAAFDIHSPSKVMEELGGYIVDGLLKAFDRITEILDKIVDFKDKVVEFFGDLGNGAIEKFQEMSDGVADAWNGMWDGIKSVINDMLGGIEDFVNGAIDGLNGLIEAFNSLDIDVPDWISDMSGVKSIGFDLPYMSNVTIPRLAQGAVLPPNKPFLAMVGDQKEGTNVETPLSTMVEAMITAINETGLANKNDSDIVIQIDGREIARATRREDQIFRKSTGHSMFAY